MQATGVLVLTNAAFIYVVFTLQYLGTFRLMIIIVLSALILTALLIYRRNRYRLKQKMQL